MQIIIGNIIDGGLNILGSVPVGQPAILMETSGYVLMEDGSHILLE